MSIISVPQDEVAGRTARTPWGPVGYLTYKRTYSRRLDAADANSRTEEYEDTVERIVSACSSQLGMNLYYEDKQAIRKIHMEMKGSVAGRFLWQLGTPTVDRLGLFSLQNCAGIVVDSPIEPFTWTMDALMLGAGVGYNIQKEHVYSLPKVKGPVEIVRKDTKDADFIVPDSREGWVELLRRVLIAHFKTGKGFSYSTMLVRGKGAVIQGFGGLASGPEELCWGMAEISKLLNRRARKKLNPIDALDIMNIIGYVVVAGNVRRSAQLAIGDYDDMQYLNAKRWDQGGIPNWRAMSNNSVVCNEFSKLPEQFWQGYQGNGEPYGLINLKLSQTVGRTGETQYPDKKVQVFNPCAEQSLEDGETCVSGDTLITTKSGCVPIAELVGKEVEVFNGVEWSCVTPVKTSDASEFLLVTFSDGSSLKTTYYHQFSAASNKNKTKFEKLKACELEVGMYLPKVEVSEVPGAVDEQAYTLGAFTGDGYLDEGDPYICAAEHVQALLFDNCLVRKSGKLWKEKERKTPMYRARVLNTLGKEIWKQLRDKEKGLPTEIMNMNGPSIKSFLAGWIDTDGSIKNRNKKAESFCIAGTEKKIKDAQVLVRRAGINFTAIALRHKKGEQTNYGIRKRDLWSLTIPTFECQGIPTVLKKISSFGTRFKSNNAHLNSAEIDSAPRQQIVSIQRQEEIEPSYCFYESKKGMGVFGNVLTYQCALAEVFLPNAESEEDLFNTVSYLYKIVKHSLALKCHQPLTEKVVHNNMRMGIGMTGIMQATPTQLDWLPRIYDRLRELDVSYSKLYNYNPSIKLTTIKPSGTMSLLPGTTPGCHPAFAQYYIRRIRVAANSPLINVCISHGYHVEPQYNFDGTPDQNTFVVSFPCAYPAGTKLAKDTSALEQLDTVRWLQKNWSDNAVSCTVYYRKDELPLIKEYLARHYDQEIKTCSFLLHQDHGFKQAPYEEITEDEYLSRKSQVRPITSLSTDTSVIESDCEGGACPVR